MGKMYIKTLEVAGFAPAFKGMRNPLDSWHLSDSYTKNGKFILGEKDRGLAQRLIRGGSEHSKFMRQIQVWADITAPRFFFSEFDTYKIGTTANSTSTMHTIVKNEITIDNFDVDNEIKEILKKEDKQKRKFIFKCELPKGTKQETKEFYINDYKYRISNEGSIYACEKYVTDSIGRVRHHPEKKLKISQNSNEYFSLRLGGRSGGLFLVHRLLAEQFIPNPDNLPFVNHIDGDKGNCSLDNLEWCTSTHNNQHAFDTGLKTVTPYQRYVAYITNRKVTLSDIEMIKQLYSKGKTQKEIGKTYDLKQTQVSVLLNDNVNENAELYEECRLYELIIKRLNEYRELYINTGDWKYVKRMKQVLPESWLQTRTVAMNYANLRNIYLQRRKHRLTEWSVNFVGWLETLPYAKELIMYEGE